jgi:ribonuclease E
LAVLRIIEEEAMKELTSKVIARLPVSAATYLLNEKRKSIQEIEGRVDVNIVVVPDPDMETPHYRVQRVRLAESEQEAHRKASYSLTEAQPEENVESRTNRTPRPAEQPAIKQIMPETPVPVAQPPRREKAAGKSLIGRLFGSLFGVSESPEAAPPPPPVKRESSADPQREGGRRRRSSRGGRGRSNRGQEASGQTKSNGQRRERSGGSNSGNKPRKSRGGRKRSSRGQDSRTRSGKARSESSNAAGHETGKENVTAEVRQQSAAAPSAPATPREPQPLPPATGTTRPDRPSPDAPAHETAHSSQPGSAGNPREQSHNRDAYGAAAQPGQAPADQTPNRGAPDTSHGSDTPAASKDRSSDEVKEMSSGTPGGTGD